MDEAEAIRRCQRGDRDGFRILVERCGRVLYGTAYLITRDAGLAEDLVQEAFLQAWRGMPSFRPGGSFKPWILRILVNQAMTKRRKRRVIEAPLPEGMATPDTSKSVEELVLEDEERQHIGRILEILPHEQRKTVVLRYYADLTVPEIARALGCREGTVKSRLHRALARLREVPLEARQQPSLREGKGAS